jgi:hypothetical protein
MVVFAAVIWRLSVWCPCRLSVPLMGWIFTPTPVPHPALVFCSGANILAYYEQYFDIEYPLPKQVSYLPSQSALPRRFRSFLPQLNLIRLNPCFPSLTYPDAGGF